MRLQAPPKIRQRACGCLATPPRPDGSDTVHADLRLGQSRFSLPKARSHRAPTGRLPLWWILVSRETYAMCKWVTNRWGNCLDSNAANRCVSPTTCGRSKAALPLTEFESWTTVTSGGATSPQDDEVSGCRAYQRRGSRKRPAFSCIHKRTHFGGELTPSLACAHPEPPEGVHSAGVDVQ